MADRSGSIYCRFIEISSLEDLGELASSFSNLTKTLYAIKSSDGYKLFYIGERIKDVKNFYYINTSTITPYAIYHNENEKMEFKLVSKIMDTNDFKSYKFLIVEIKNVFKELKTKGTFKLVNIKDYKAMIKRLALRSIEKGTREKVYVFRYKNSKVLFSFNLFGEDNMFAYSSVDNADLKKDFKMFRCNFSDDEVKFADGIDAEDSNDIYIKAINLKKPFSFFTMPG